MSTIKKPIDLIFKTLILNRMKFTLKSQYGCATYNGKRYSSESYKEIKTCDYFVELKDSNEFFHVVRYFEIVVEQLSNCQTTVFYRKSYDFFRMYVPQVERSGWE